MFWRAPRRCSNDAAGKEQVVGALLQIMFRETEESTWPVEYAWKAVQGAKLEDTAYQRAVERLHQGSRPTLGALAVLAAYPVRHWKTEHRALQPYWRTWFPDRGVREVVSLQRIVDAATWSKERYRAALMKQLSDMGYARLAARYWKRNRAAVEGDVDAWAETARALSLLKRRREVRTLLEGWRERDGVRMWSVANYVNSLTGLGKAPLTKVRSACRDALAGLPHDHCAKYLVHRQMEACALLGDETGVLETWKAYRNYFDGKLEKAEWFDTPRKYLLGDLLVLGRSLEANDRKMYKKLLRSLRWKKSLCAYNRDVCVPAITPVISSRISVRMSR